MNFVRKSLFGIYYSIVDYSNATDIIITNAKDNKSFAVSALAVHGLITAVIDSNVFQAVSKINMLVPDGQPVRWALNAFYNVGLKDRVYGPKLTLHVLQKANELQLKIYLFGSTATTLEKLVNFIKTNYPRVSIVGIHNDRFREATIIEDMDDIQKINKSGAQIVLVGRGCPRQEIWVAEHIGKINAVMMAVGAAFDFHAGTLRQAPKWMQENGLEWLFRLTLEPRRLWKRYLITNSLFIWLCIKECFKRILTEKQ